VTLDSVHLFKNLSPDELKALQAIAQNRSFTAGQEVFREGDPGDGIYIIQDGLVEISAFPGKGPPHILSELGPGEVFGEMAVIEQNVRSATARALKDSTLYFLPRGEMLALLNRSPVLAMNALQEISHRLRAFNQLHLREIMQAERLAILGTFARSIIHDLKTPLTIIGLSSEMANLPTATPEKRAQSLERIRKQINRINDMVGDILEFTRTQQLKAQTTASYLDFINELLPELRAETEARTICIELENAVPPLTVVLDAKRLRRVFFNLVHNACDVLPDNGKILLRFKVDQNEVVTEVEDTGRGIAPEIADKLFQPFVTHGKKHGTGLGLSICKKTIEDHGGRIWYRAEPKRGAIFCFSLPVAGNGQ
jgi:signal transduction histidine kinase